MRWGGALIGLALLGATGGDLEIAGMRHPALSPDGEWIAFDWSGDIWVCPSGGGTARRLTHDPSHEQKPAWSLDGTTIAFAGDRQGNLDLYLLDVATLGVEPLTFHSSDDDAPAWSPDGKSIAFQSTRDSNLDLAFNDRVWDVWRMEAGGGTATRVTRFRGENPAWSPDGEWIAYDRYATGYNDGEHNIFVVSADGSGIPREVAAGSEDSRRPAFRGGDLYFAHEANGIHRAGNRNVWKTSLKGGALRQVTGHARDQVTWPTTSENHPFLVYEHGFGLHTLDLRKPGSKPRKLRIVAEAAQADPGVSRVLIRGMGQPAWSPSGARIAFTCRGDIWTVAADGGEAKRVSASLDEDRDPFWSSDGRSLVYISRPWGGPGHVAIISSKGGKGRPVTREPGFYANPCGVCPPVTGYST